MTDDELRTVLAERLAGIRGRIAAACARAGRQPDEVTLVAVTKTVSSRVARVMAELGVLDLGESRPQELWKKAAELADLPIRWHLVGHLQRNKVERTLPLVHMIHSVDSLRLYDAISEEANRQRRLNLLLLQINASEEGQKHGFDYDELLQAIQSEPKLRHAPADSTTAIISGLMGMAAYSDDPEKARPTFRQLREFRDRLRDEWPVIGSQFGHLSMGMSGDFEVAIEEGATLIRIGTTLFEGLEGE